MKRTSRAAFVAVVLCALFVVGRPGTALPLPADAAARGLDFVIHGALVAPSGDALHLSVEALGFPSVSTTTTLAGATFEAAWDPESFHEHTAPPPPSVRATANDSGHAVLDVPMPGGEPMELTLVVSVRFGDKQRVHELRVQRSAPAHLSLFVSDRQVVPGGQVSAWVLYQHNAGDAPIAETPVEFKLLEGGVARFEATATTDAAGSAMFRVPIPRSSVPGITWTLTARALGAQSSATSEASVDVMAREETPGKPQFSVRFDEGSVKAGDDAHYRVRLRDASDEGVANHSVLVWTGPRGVDPPKDDRDFAKAATALETDGAGELVAPVRTPTTIPLKGTAMRVVAKTESEGVELAAEASVEVGKKRGVATLTPEAKVIVPGIEQHVLLRLTGDDLAPAVGTFDVTADGLKTTVETDAHGEADVVWKVPEGIGARRDVGPCPGGVAAAVNVRARGDAKGVSTTAFEGALVGADGLALCVPIDRASTLFLRPVKSVVRAGEDLKLEIAGDVKHAFSLVGTSQTSSESHAEWIEHGEDGAVFHVPASASGVWRFSIAGPRSGQRALEADASVLVLPKVLPRVRAKVVGRAVPGGTVTVEATLEDENGHGLPGSVAVAVMDKLGGGSFGSLASLDERASLCADVGAESDRCDEVLGGDDKANAFRRSLLVDLADRPLGLVRDPGATLKSDVDATFRAVVHSLEGAVWEASASPEKLIDVRRKEGGKYVFNPELMTLVTSAMDKPPAFPGGETVALNDILSLDGQITYDNVGRRLTRLKLFDVLKAIRDYRRSEQIDPADPVFKDPNALLRRLVHDGSLQSSQLLDPWGGTLQFFQANGEVVPFLTVTKGFELRSPGPDGKIGTGDDVRDPFERVLKSGTPYADAVDEDQLVDAKWDMRVADATVENWSKMLREMTGTELGGLGLSGVGEGGGGRGEGIGFGSIGTIGHGAGRGTFANSDGIAYWSPPKRTDAAGHITFEIPLGSIETTWEVALVGLADDARPAVGTVDVPVTLPLSAKVFAGARWIEGDTVGVAITVRNRGDADVDASVSVEPSGAVSLVGAGDARVSVKVARHGATTTTIHARAHGTGAAKLKVTTSAPGAPDDVLTHEIDVEAAGEMGRITHAAWITDEADLSKFIDRAPLLGMGPATLTLERGTGRVLDAALRSLDPDTMRSTESLADAIDVATLVRGYAVARGGDADPLAVVANKTGEYARGKLSAIRSHGSSDDWVTSARAARVATLPTLTDCPGEAGGDWASANGLDAEPPPKEGSVKACWTTFVAEAENRLSTSTDAATVARGVLAFARRPHRALDATELAKHLRKIVKIQPTGVITLDDATPATRTLVYAALIAGAEKNVEPSKDILFEWLECQRDASGSFGTPSATRAAVQVLTGATAPAYSGTVSVEVVATPGKGDKETKVVTVDAEGSSSLDVPAGTAKLVVRIRGPAGAPGDTRGVFARLDRGYLRPFSVAPDTFGAPLALAVTWPEAKRGAVANVRVRVESLRKVSEPVEVRLALPPGAMLADSIEGARQVQGAIYLRTNADADRETLVPIRFTLSGNVTVPEPTAELVERQLPLAYDRARPLVIAP